MRMVVTSLKLPPDLLTELRKRAWQESLRTGQPVSWGSLVRRAIEEHVLDSGSVKNKPGRTAAGT